MPVKEIIPKEGVTGWLDTWMLSSKAKHPNCAYKWYPYISTPRCRRSRRRPSARRPVNKLACTEMDKLARARARQYHADAPEAYYSSIKFWKTPVADCGNGKSNCMDYTKWQSAPGLRRPLAARRGGRVVHERPAVGSRRDRSGGGRGCAGSRCCCRRSAGCCVFYVAALAVLFVSAFWSVDVLHGKLVAHLDLGNFRHDRDQRQT